MNKLQLKRYAKLLAKTGINVKRGQWVIVHAGLDQPEFVEWTVEELYRAGAGKVTVEWAHQPLSKLKYKYEKDGLVYHATDTLTFRNRIRDGVNEWQDENQEHYK